MVQDFANALNCSRSMVDNILKENYDYYISNTITANICKIIGIEPKKLYLFDFYLPDKEIKNIESRNVGFDYKNRNEEIAKGIEREKNRIDRKISGHNKKRKELIQNLRENGLTYEEIGEIVGISRQRVEQIVNNNKKIYKKSRKRKDLTVFYHGKKYTSQKELMRILFPDVDPDYMQRFFYRKVKETGISLENAIDMVLKTHNLPTKKNRKRVFYHGKRYISMNKLFRTHFEEAKIKRAQYFVKKEMSKGLPFEKAYDYVRENYTSLDNKIVFEVHIYKTYKELCLEQLPSMDYKKAYDSIRNRMKSRKISLNEAVNLLKIKKPVPRKNIVISGIVYKNKKELVSCLFSNKSYEKAMSSIHYYMQKYECDFEEAVKRSINKKKKNDYFNICYNDKVYRSMTSLCKELSIKKDKVFKLINNNNYSWIDAVNKCISS